MPRIVARLIDRSGAKILTFDSGNIAPRSVRKAVNEAIGKLIDERGLTADEGLAVLEIQIRPKST